MLRTHFPQPSLFNRPAQVRAHQTVVPGAIDRELLAMNVGEAVLPRALKHELRRWVEICRGRDPMQSGQITQILVRSGATGLVSERCPLLSGQERLLGNRRKSPQHQNEADHTEATHTPARISPHNSGRIVAKPEAIQKRASGRSELGISSKPTSGS